MVSFSEIKEKVSLTDAVKMLGLQLTEHNGALRGPCPSCNAGGSRALVVTPERGAYCFHAKKGGDVLFLASHIKGIDVKAAAEFLNGTDAPKAREEQIMNTQPGGLKPLDHLDHKHEKVMDLISLETAQALEVGWVSRGVLTQVGKKGGCVAVAHFDLYGQRHAYVGIEDDGTLRFIKGFVPTLHLFNAHRVTDDEVQILPTVEDVLRAYEQGVTAICFLTPTVNAEQLKALGDWLTEHGRTLTI